MADVKMVNLTIEGRPVTVPDGTSILEAAKTAGVLIPHYCYHPGLPVAGVCRMCLVEVEKAPKLAPACATPVASGIKKFRADFEALIKKKKSFMVPVPSTTDSGRVQLIGAGA
jgi:NADH-quinone oxidoreductase subunit G